MSQEQPDPVFVAKLEQLADVVRAVLDDDFTIAQCIDSRGLEFTGVMIRGKLMAILPEPIEATRPAGGSLQ
jgi:hypothetical protein